jgi:hypothetical protein
MNTPPRTVVNSCSIPSSILYSASSDNSHESIPRTQDALQDTMKIKLYNAVFQSEAMLDKLCPADPKTVDLVIVDLKKTHRISHDNLQWANPRTPGTPLTPWPNVNLGERPQYEPLAWLLNSILSSSRRGMDIRSLNKKLHFFPYDRTMVEGVEGDSPLKPDLVGCDLETLPSGHRVSWKDVKISCEVKASWPDMIARASAYARCHLTFQENRRFTVVIHFHYAKMAVRVGFYTRSGLSITKAFVISTADGFRNLVRAMVGINSWTN